MTDTANKDLNLPALTDGGWATSLNQNWDIIDSALGDVAVKAVTSGPYTLSAAEYQCAVIQLTGSIGANTVTIKLPDGVSGTFVFDNGTTATSGKVVLDYVTTGTTYTLGQGAAQIVSGDGTNRVWASVAQQNPAQMTSITVGSTDITLTEDQYRNSVFFLSGVVSGTPKIVWPTGFAGQVTIMNNCSSVAPKIAIGSGSTLTLTNTTTQIFATCGTTSSAVPTTWKIAAASTPYP